MRPTLWLCLAALLFVSGCTKSKLPQDMPPVAPEPEKSDLYLDASPDGPSAPAAFLGRSAEQWGQQLVAPQLTYEERKQAAEALAQLHEKGFGELLQAMRDKAPEIRLAAMEAVSPAEMTKNDKNTVPVLLDMLKDPNEEVRKQAAHRLAWFDRTSSSKLEAGHMAQERLKALLATYQFDNSRDVQLAARNSVLSVYDHMRGRLDCPPGAAVGIEKDQ